MNHFHSVLIEVLNTAHMVMDQIHIVHDITPITVVYR